MPANGVATNGTEIRLRRQLGGDNLVAFAKKAQISFQHLSEIELGQKQPSPEAFKRICDALGIPAGDRRQLLAEDAA
jgi:transcriptional regulator with XRE-family HTH domain